MHGRLVATSTPVAGDELVWIDRGDGPRAAMWHPATAPARDVALVICPPLGYEATCCQRALRHLAQASAAAGVAALRLAYHGTGDSDGDDAQPARVATWRDDVAMAIDEARRRAGVTRVVLVGVRLGATLATLVAAGRDDVDTVVAMAPVVSGRSLARELRAFRKLAEVDLAMPAGVANVRREGDEEVAGFLFTAETLAALAEIDLGKLSLGPARVTLIARDDLAGGEGRLAEALRDIGTTVELIEEPGFAAMNQDPHKSVSPSALWRRIVDGAVARSGGRAATPAGTSRAAATATLREPAGGVRERFVRLGPARAAAVITTGASGVVPGAPALVWLNAGAVARLGPSRLHVTLARRWARRGVTSVRVDLPGFGDTDATPDGGEHPLYDRGVVDQVLAIVDALHAELGGAPVVLGGLCAGAFASFWTAARAASTRGPRPPIVGALLINPQTFHFRPGDSLDVSSRATFRQTRYYQKRLGQADAWRRLLRGDVPVQRVVDAFARRARDVAQARARAVALRLGRGAPEAVELVRALRELDAARIAPVFVFSGDDPGLDNLEGLLGKRLALAGDRVAGGVGWQVLDGPDHTFTPLWAQAQLTAALEQLLLPRFWRGSAP